jgi:type I restriction enzyme S subunit
MTWINKQFGDCAELIRNSIQPDLSSSLNYIGLEHISQGGLELLSTGKSEDVISQKSLFRQGDILFGKLRPYFRKIIIAPFDGVCSTDIWVVRAKPGYDQRFLFYWMATKEFVNNASQASEGTKMPRASWEYVSKFEKLIPTLIEQRAIADVLSALDDKIELNRRMDQTLEELAQTLFKNWFVNNPESKNWENGILGDDFNLTMGQSPPGSSYNEDRIGVPFFQGKTDFGFRYPDNRIYCTAPTRFAKAGDTLVSVRAPVGNTNLAFEDCAIGRGVAAVRHRSNSRSFTYYSLQNLYPEFQNFESEGTVFGSINKDSFLSLKVIRPPAELVNLFEETCFPIDQLIENNLKESRTLIELRDTLLPKLMSGQVRVKHD